MVLKVRHLICKDLLIIGTKLINYSYNMITVMELIDVMIQLQIYFDMFPLISEHYNILSLPAPS